MEICIDNLKTRPFKLAFREPIERFPLLIELVKQGDLEFRGDVAAELIAIQSGVLVEVDGILSCSVVTACSRCLYPFEQQLELPVALAFSRLGASAVDLDDERELTAEDAGLIEFGGDTIDLRNPLEQEVLMALPQHPLCRCDCAGLCPSCGADLNRSPCDCSPPVFHGGLAVLKGFKVTKE